MRLLVLNGIESITTRQDAIDRSVIIYLPKIAPDRRRPERAFWAEFEQARPRILGALLTAASVALRDVGTVGLDELPRMADFAMWVTAGEKSFGWSAGSFMAAYREPRGRADQLARRQPARRGDRTASRRLHHGRQRIRGMGRDPDGPVRGALQSPVKERAQLAADRPSDEPLAQPLGPGPTRRGHRDPAPRPRGKRTG